MSYDAQNKRAYSPQAIERTSTSSSDSSLKVPRTPRFAEATSVHSPIDQPSESGRSPFADPPEHNSHTQQSQPSDIGFGYISQSHGGQDVPPAPASPLKSAMRVPGTPGRKIDNPLSPTFREEQFLEKQEQLTEVQQAKDLKVKVRVRMAKMVLRVTNFSCSLIVLAMLSATFTIFNATKALPPRSNLPAWAANTKTWPQIVCLVVACVSLALSLVVFWAYLRGGHKRAEKTAVYYTLFAIGFFIFNIVMWGIAAGILQGTRNNSGNKDMWGWSCVDNKRRQVFQDDVNYALVCRLQSWSLICCIIEVVVETLTIAIYSIVFYRYYSKRKLRKSMDHRENAKRDLYLAQLRSQSAPNTPGFGPKSPGFHSIASPRFPPSAYTAGDDVEHARPGYVSPGTRFVDAPSSHTEIAQPKPFALQAPPIKIHSATPRSGSSSGGFSPVSPVQSNSPPPQAERLQQHAPVAPGEQMYGEVPIPGAYASPLNSPGFAPSHVQTTAPGGFQSLGQVGQAGHVGQAVTSERRIESPPSSPRFAPRFQ